MQTSDQAEAALIRAVIANNTAGRYTAETLSGALSLTSLGIDSLKFILVILEIEAKIGRKIFNVANVGTARTVDDLLGIVISKGAGEVQHGSP